MKKKTKIVTISISCISVVLVLILLYKITPLNNLFNDNDKGISTQENQAKILYEVEEKRNEFTKVYKKSDGTYSAFISNVPVNYLDNGEWKEIDNSLINEDNTTYTNSANKFNVELPKNLSQDDKVRVEKDGYSISFSIDEAKNWQNAKIDNAKEKAENTKDDKDVAAMADTSSSITYKNVLKNTDVEYQINGETVKENIIINKLSAVKEKYSFTITAEGLNAILNNDNSVSFKNPENADVFLIPAPVMLDEKNEISNNIGVELVSNNDGTYKLIYTPDYSWLSAENRDYPVTLDPIIAGVGTWFITDACVTTENPDLNSNNSALALVVNNFVDNGVTINAESYIKVNTDYISQLIGDSTVTEAHFIAEGMVGDKLAIKEIDGYCDFETVTYNTKPDLKSEIVDYYTPKQSDIEACNIIRSHFNITNYLNRILTNPDENNGLAIISPVVTTDQNSSLLIGNGKLGNSTQSGMGIIIDFVDMNGYDSRYSYHTQDIGRAGTGYVNDFTRQLFLKRNDLSIDGNIMPVSLSFMYNSAMKEFFNYVSVKNLLNDDMDVDSMQVYGDNWMSNYNRMIFISEYDGFAGVRCLHYLTEDGAMLNFYEEETEDENSNNTINFIEEGADIYGSSGYSVELIDNTIDYIESPDNIEVTRPDGNVEHFDEGGRLISVTKTVQTNDGMIDQSINIHYVNNSFDNNFFAIDYITDGVGRKYDFEYSNGLLCSVQCKTENDELLYVSDNMSTPLQTNYTYSNFGNKNNNLTSIISYDGIAITYCYNNKLLYEANESELNKYIYYYINNSGNINNITEMKRMSVTNGFTEFNHLNISTDGPFKVSFIDRINQVEVCQYDIYGRKIKAYNNSGEYANIDRTNNINSYLELSTNSWKKISENYLDNSSFEDIDDLGRALVWENGIDNSSFSISNIEAHSGENSCHVDASTIALDTYRQTINVSDCDSATFSLYAKNANNNLRTSINMSIVAYNINNEIVFEENESLTLNETNWKGYI